MTEKTGDPALETTRLLVSQAVGALAVALATAAATVVVLAWVGTWDDVEEVCLANYLFWPPAVAAVTLQIAARRLGGSTPTSGTSG